MTEKEALREIIELLPGPSRGAIAEKRGQAYRVGFTDGEFYYWLGSSEMGYAMAMLYLKRRISKARR